MADQKIILTSTNPGGQTLQKTLTDINPDATNAQLKTFGQKLNALTNNTYGKTDRIIKYNCDTEEGGGSQTATITLSASSVDLATLKTELKGASRLYQFTATYDGDGQLYAVVQGNMKYLGVSAPDNNAFRIFSASDDAVALITAPATIKVRADATDNFKAAEATFTVTA